MADYKVLTVGIRLLGSNSCLSLPLPQPCRQGLDADDVSSILYFDLEPLRERVEVSHCMFALYTAVPNSLSVCVVNYTVILLAMYDSDKVETPRCDSSVQMSSSNVL